MNGQRLASLKGVSADPINAAGIARVIGSRFDGNRDKALTGPEAWAFLREVMIRLEAAGLGRSGLTEPGRARGAEDVGGVRIGRLPFLFRGPERPSAGEPTRSAPHETRDALRHMTDFLTLRSADGRTLYTQLYAGYSASDRAAVRDALRARGYTHIYLYVVNEGDLGGAHFDGYRDARGFRDLLAELVDDGLAPVVWLAPDDAPTFHKTSERALPGLWDSFIPAIDDLVSSYVVGLEMDEYWSPAVQNRLGEHLDGLTDRPLFVHFGAGQWEGAKRPWVDGLIYQYGFRLTEQQIVERTRQLVARLHALGKTFIAGEYAYRVSEAHARRLGAAALRAGADGAGNGA